MKVAVTGANKGIGHAIVLKLLADPAVGEVYFTARDPALGQKALQDFTAAAKGKKVEALPLDILAEGAVENFVKEVKAKNLQFDVFINNAGVYLADVTKEVLDKQFRVNYTFPIELTHALLKEGLVKKGGRFVYVSSGMGNAGTVKDHAAAAKAFGNYKSADFTEKTLEELSKQYVAEVLDASKGWGNGLYGHSKLFLTTHVNALSRSNKDHEYYSICPGFVDTDMTKGAGATRTPAEGADTPAYVATAKLEAAQNGEFFKERAVASIL